MAILWLTTKTGLSSMVVSIPLKPIKPPSSELTPWRSNKENEGLADVKIMLPLSVETT